MKIKELKKATKILSKIKELDAEIIEIEKKAMLVADSETLCSFELSFKQPEKQANSDVRLDEDGSLIINRERERGLYDIILNPFTPYRTYKQEPDSESLKYRLSANVTLQILGVLLYEKQSQREILMKEINSLGIED